jgi:hypothetical protein
MPSTNSNTTKPIKPIRNHSGYNLPRFEFNDTLAVAKRRLVSTFSSSNLLRLFWPRHLSGIYLCDTGYYHCARGHGAYGVDFRPCNTSTLRLKPESLLRRRVSSTVRPKHGEEMATNLPDVLWALAIMPELATLLHTESAQC